MMTFRNATIYFSAHPRQLFLADAIGATVSALLMVFVLVKHVSFFGIPESTLFFLASLPCAFASFDLICFFFCKKQFNVFLQTIAALNFSYCCVSVAMASFHYDSLTIWGWLYVFAEVLIVGALARFEWRIAKNHVR